MPEQDIPSLDNLQLYITIIFITLIQKLFQAEGVYKETQKEYILWLVDTDDTQYLVDTIVPTDIKVFINIDFQMSRYYLSDTNQQ